MTKATPPFHAGGQTIQSLAGVRDRMERKGRAVIRDYMPEQHRSFFAALPFIVVGLADQNGHPWATTLSGPPGFMSSADEKLLTIKAWIDPSDPLHLSIGDGAPVGGLGIELSTRRRNRLNGRVENCIIGEAFSIRVQQSFGNCPKYIQARNERPQLRSKHVPAPRMASHLGDSEICFDCRSRHVLYRIPIGAARPGGALARSRRLPPWRTSRLRTGGFTNRTLLSGFQRQPALQHTRQSGSGRARRASVHRLPKRQDTALIGRARICWDGPEMKGSAGIERLIFLDIACVVNRDHAFPHLFDFVSYSPQLGTEG